MTAEWLHLPPPYPPGVGPLCGAELEAWYEDLQDILGSDAGGAKMARAPSCGEKEPEFLDVLESCSLTWLTEGGQTWGEGVQRATEQVHNIQPLHHTSSCLTPSEERKTETSARSGDGDLLPPEFFEFLSEGGMVDSSSGYYYHHHHHNQQQQVDNVHPASPSASEEELPCVPDSPSCSSSSASQSPPSQRCLSPSSPVSSPSVYSPSRPSKRRRSQGPDGASSSPGVPSQSQQRASSSYLSAKKSRKEREQENEKKVQELTEQNERLKAEIERLGEEVQRTRRALIERLVNTRK
ncbi:DNA damage-inducible transcript 3 protein [Corythoichthys intestinalis]|uniref:DNA damage-inducible transcript 3 protein n=1 Tax=Corythoichthys intestinalis TaxID=161448 RepID=UPI0025A62217|nr:DNA damage-inducible transcript 3 protein [Corythoichthys intestinalis]XP_061813552.1 DNA damage-inducible transcript 3 protein-like [Nerophis lumbriciformis]